MATTLLLDTGVWDLTLDADGNIAVASDPYSVAQDVASACRTWLGEVYFDTTIGVPYDQIMGEEASFVFIKSQLQAAALTVDGVSNPVVYISSIKGRVLVGQVQFTDTNTGQVMTAPLPGVGSGPSVSASTSAPPLPAPPPPPPPPAAETGLQFNLEPNSQYLGIV